MAPLLHRQARAPALHPRPPRRSSPPWDGVACAPASPPSLPAALQRHSLRSLRYPLRVRSFDCLVHRRDAISRRTCSIPVFVTTEHGIISSLLTCNSAAIALVFLASSLLDSLSLLVSTTRSSIPASRVQPCICLSGSPGVRRASSRRNISCNASASSRYALISVRQDCSIAFGTFAYP